MTAAEFWDAVGLLSVPDFLALCFMAYASFLLVLDRLVALMVRS